MAGRPLRRLRLNPDRGREVLDLVDADQYDDARVAASRLVPDLTLDTVVDRVAAGNMPKVTITQPGADISIWSDGHVGITRSWTPKGLVFEVRVFSHSL